MLRAGVVTKNNPCTNPRSGEGQTGAPSHQDGSFVGESGCYEGNKGDLSCCGMDHADKCTSCFCMCARRVESQEDDTICWNWFLGGWFARRALGSESTPGSRSAWGTLWPLWLLITAILYVVEAIIRVSILLAIIITICTVAVVALIVISIIVGILIVVAIWVAIVCIISCILCWPCYLCLCCCNCCTAILKAAAS